MPENLGPGEWLSIQMTVDEYIAEASDLQLQLLQNSQHLRLKQKNQSDEITQIHNRYQTEQSLIRNEMRNSKTGELTEEYYELMIELQESQDKEDMEIAVIENESSDYESKIETENTMLETQIEAINEDKSNLKEAQKSNIEGQ